MLAHHFQWWEAATQYLTTLRGCWDWVLGAVPLLFLVWLFFSPAVSSYVLQHLFSTCAHRTLSFIERWLNLMMVLCICQVYAWGDNDHGQQGNGTTTVNRKPTLVQGLEGQKITRVACGSSHSVAWTTVDVTTPSVHEPVLFQTARDSLGASYLGNPPFPCSILTQTTCAVFVSHDVMILYESHKHTHHVEQAAVCPQGGAVLSLSVYRSSIYQPRNLDLKWK